jgi:hypothetical protein
LDRYFGSDIEPERFVDLLRQLGQQAHIDEPTLRQFVKDAISKRIQVEAALPPRHDLDRAAGLIKFVGLHDWSRMRLRLAQANILQRIDEGLLPGNVRLVGPVPLNLEAGEAIVYVFNGVSRYSMHSHSRYVGGSSGVSFRIARGVYYRVGGSRGHSIRTERLARDGTGDLVVTTKNVIFLAATGPTKIPAKKIVSVQTLSDGIVVLRDGVHAKQEIYSLPDPWFAGQLISRSGRLNGLRKPDKPDDRSDEGVVSAIPPPTASRRASVAPWAWAGAAAGLAILVVLILGSMSATQPPLHPPAVSVQDTPKVPQSTASVPQQKTPAPKPKQQPGKPLDLQPPAYR